MLSVTADNATANDVMIDELEDLVESFRGQVARVRCFDHTINLIVKTILRQFDTERNKKGADNTAFDQAEAALRDLLNTEDIEDEDSDSDNVEGEWDVDDVEDWVDECKDLTEEEVSQLEETTRPVKLVLVKVA